MLNRMNRRESDSSGQLLSSSSPKTNNTATSPTMNMKRRSSLAVTPSTAGMKSITGGGGMSPQSTRLLRPGQILEEGPKKRRGSFDSRSENIKPLLDMPSIPLIPSGESGPPKILEVPENVTCDLGETAILLCKIESNPVPSFKWLRGIVEIENSGRYKHVTRSEDNSIALLIQKTRASDDGPYTIQVENEFGTDSIDVRLFVTDPSTAMDFRSTLKKRDYEKWQRDGFALEEAELKSQEVTPVLIPKPQKKSEYFEKELDDMIARIGDKVVKFTCIFSNPNAKVRWYKNKTELFEGLKCSMIADRNVLSLVINKPDMDDAAKYTCEANGLISSAALIVQEPHMKYTFVKPLPAVVDGITTKQVVIECKVSHTRAPVKWIYNDKEIDSRDPRFLVEKDAMGRCCLTIKSAEKADAGKWLAKIDEENFSITELVIHDLRHEFAIPLKSQKVSEKDTATLECELNEKDIDVEWWHDGVKITIDGKKYEEVKLGRKRKLIVKNCGISDQGEFKCTTRDDQSQCQLLVEPANRFLEPLKDVTGYEKEDVTLSCQCKNYTAGAVWFKNGQKITVMAGTKYEAQSKNGTHLLTIRNLYMTDGDEYEIETGGLEARCRVTVLEAEKKPVFNWKSKKLEAQVAKPLIVKIPYSIKGNRRVDPKASLLRNGQAVSCADGVDVLVETDQIVIKLDSCAKSDTGKWELNLSNTGGATSVFFETDVKDKPGSPQGPIDVSEISAECCKLKWKPPKEDGGSPVTGYIIEAQKDNGQWYKVGESKKLEFKPSNLEKLHKYKFRVSAVNQIGQSEPLATDDEILAKDPYDPPEKSRNLQAIDIDRDHVTLSWQIPENDGNSPILKYVVERAEKGGKNEEFQVLGEVTAKKKLEFSDSKVEENKEYVYRVKAVNKAGEGEPCEVKGGSVLAKAKPAAPTLDKVSLRNQRVKIGETIKFSVAIGGEPPPEVTWSLNSNAIGQKGNVKIIVEKQKTVLEIANAQRLDAGTYTLMLRNPSGSETGSANVQVVGKPSPPEGPLSACDIHKDGCTLNWKKPVDDGGEPIEGYTVEAQDPSGNWIQVWRSIGADTSANIRGLKTGTNYKFRVKAVNREGESQPLDTEETVLIKDPWDPPSKVQDVRTIDVDKDHVTLAWKPPLDDGNAPIEKYVVERREKGAKEFSNVGEVSASRKTEFTDNRVTENREYEYRIRAVNKAGPGEAGELEHGCVLVKAKPDGPSLDKLGLKDLKIRVGETIKYDVRIGGEPVPEVKWFHNDQEIIAAAGRIKINSEKTRAQLTIEKATRLDRGTYRIQLQNNSGILNASANVLVVGKPNSPEGPLLLSGIHKDGCTLSWKPPSDDGGEPLEDYVIEAQVKSGRWITLGKVGPTDTKFQASGLKNKADYNFRVKAKNKEGESEPLEAETATKIKDPFDEPGKPGTPLVTDWDKDRVDLLWTPPDNDGGAPVEKYVVEKLDPVSKKWSAVLETKETKASVMGLRDGNEYQFRVKAVNKAGPGEPSDPCDRITTKQRFAHASLALRPLENLTVKSGQVACFIVDLPADLTTCEVVWRKNGSELRSSAGLVVEIRPGFLTSVNIKKTTADDSGCYSVTMKGILARNNESPDRCAKFSMELSAWLKVI